MAIHASLEVGPLRVPGEIRDMSRGGLLFLTRRPLDVGEEAQLVHQGPLGKSVVRVIRREVHDDGTVGLGLSFVGGSPVPGTPLVRA